MPAQRVGITGANGTIGRVLMKGLNMEGDCELTPFTRRPVDFPSTIVHFDSAAEVEGAFQNLDAVIHLAADTSPSANWERIRTHNIDAMYLVLEECRRAAVKRLVFASTNHTMHGNSILTTPETLDASTAIRMKLDDPPNPDSYYAVSKLFGENLGKLYSEQHGVEFVGLRIGWLTAGDDPTAFRGTASEDYMRAMFLSHRDCVEAHRCALKVETKFLLAYVISDNDRRVFDLEETAAVLGFEPLDNAEDYFAH